MSIEASLNAHLRDTSSVTDIVGTRIRPGFSGYADAFPYITYGLTSRRRHRVSSGQTALVESTFAVDVFGDSDSSKNGYLDSIDAADAVINAISGLNGTLGDATTNEDAKVTLVSEDDVDVPVIPGEFIPPFQRRLVFNISHRVTVPTLP